MATSIYGNAWLVRKLALFAQGMTSTMIALRVQAAISTSTTGAIKNALTATMAIGMTTLAKVSSISFINHSKECHSACTLCFGASSKQCSNCTEILGLNEIGELSKAGYLLQGTACNIPKCIEGQYFLWSKDPVTYLSYGKCDYCHPRCKRCSGPLSTQCS